jgi:hypothetical protein
MATDPTIPLSRPVAPPILEYVSPSSRDRVAFSRDAEGMTIHVEAISSSPAGSPRARNVRRLASVALILLVLAAAALTAYGRRLGSPAVAATGLVLLLVGCVTAFQFLGSNAAADACLGLTVRLTAKRLTLEVRRPDDSSEWRQQSWPRQHVEAVRPLPGALRIDSHHRTGHWQGAEVAGPFDPDDLQSLADAVTRELGLPAPTA